MIGKTKIADLVSGHTVENTAAVFTLNRLPFDLTEDAEKPQRWLRFLDEIFPGDPESIACLQEWFGYLLTGRTDMQKMLYMVGPPRSGKGTLMHIMKELVGAPSTASASTHTLGGQFALADWLGKSLVTFPDVREGRMSQAAVERLLTVSGEDTVTVARKFKGNVNTQLKVRIVLASNDVTNFADVSGALVSRLLTIEMRETFEGREDTNLLNELRGEIWDIAAWAREGLRRLDRQSRFTEATSGKALREELDRIGNTVRDWIDEEVELGKGFEVECGETHRAYNRWCRGRGFETLNDSMFGKKLRAATDRNVEKRGRDGNRRKVYVGMRLRSPEDEG